MVLIVDYILQLFTAKAKKKYVRASEKKQHNMKTH